MSKKFVNKGGQTISIKLKENNKTLVIYKDGKLYYSRDIEDFNNIDINLKHAGIYIFSIDFDVNNIQPLIINNPVVKSSLPSYDRNYPVPTDWKKNIDTGYTPARMYAQHGIIESGLKFNKYPYEWRIFILCHEFAHSKYKSEMNADLLGFYIFCELGYNHSQALYALSKVLHDGTLNNERINQLYNLIKTNN